MNQNCFTPPADSIFQTHPDFQFRNASAKESIESSRTQKFHRSFHAFLWFVMLGAITSMNAATLTNGVDQPGVLVLHTTNTYTFYATNGDSIVLRDGAPGLRPLLNLRAPNGSIVAGNSGGTSSANDAFIMITLVTNGDFTVEISSYYGTGSGDYNLRLAHVPGAFVVSPDEQGGTLTNGAVNSGTIDLGDLDMWSFTANAGDTLMLRMGTTGFRPRIDLYDPNGALIASSAGSSSSSTDAPLLTDAKFSGTYTVVAHSYYIDGTGSYTLTLAQIPEAFVVSLGDEGGQLANGAATPGNWTKGDMDLWTFDSTAGETVFLRIGSPGIRPLIRLYGPDGKLLATDSGGTSSAEDAVVQTITTNTGTFTAVVQGYYENVSGPYRLTLAKIPGMYVVSFDDGGGALVNGKAHQATNSLGDIDMWSFAANHGDNLALRIGAPDFRPTLNLYGPDGKLIATSSGGTSSARDVGIFVQATNSGAFMVLVQSYYPDGAGPYTLNFGQFPGAFATSNGDEGGALTNSISRDGIIALGDLDFWSFNACKGYPISLTVEKLSGTFTPRIRLYGANGSLLATAQNATLATLSYPGTNSGSYEVMIDGAGANDNGTYRLTGYGIYGEGLNLCPPLVSGTNLNLSGFGGIASSNFVIVTATNLTTPLTLWQPLLTNQFDSFGGFDHTNQFILTDKERYFRLRTEN